MTIFEMVYMFDRELETISPQFKIKEKPDTDTLLSYINKAQEVYFNDIYLSKGSFKDNAEFLQRVVSDELVKLIQTTGPITAASVTFQGHPYAYRYSTTLSQYAHYIDSYSLFSRSQPKSISEQWTINDIADSTDDLRKVETNSYNKPILRNPIVFLDGSDNLNTAGNIYIYVITDAYTTMAASLNLNIRYLRKPKVLDFTAVSGTSVTTSELMPSKHEDIVKLAMELYKKDKFQLISKE